VKNNTRYHLKTFYMTKKIILTASLLAIMLIFVLSSCTDCIDGNGKMATRTAKFNEITSINLSVSADVKLVDDSTGIVRIYGESNIIEAIILEQTGTALKITSKPCFSANEPVTITIPMKNVSELLVNGSGDFMSEGNLSAIDLELGINGSGNIDLNVNATNVVSKINGSGNVNLKGAAQRHKIEVNGSGNVNAENFPTSNISITVDGSGDCNVFATQALGIKIRGSGNVYYGGSPDISSDIKGSGSLEKIK